MTLAVVAALASCSKDDGAQAPNQLNSMLTAEAGLTMTTRSIVTTEAAIDAASSEAELEVDIYTMQADELTRSAESAPQAPTAPNGRYKGGASSPLLNLYLKARS